MKNLNAPLAIFAGLMGGVFSHYFLPQPVQAQALASVPDVVRAQSFVLVDASGKAMGTFAVGKPSQRSGGAPSIELYNANGRRIWVVGNNAMKPIDSVE